MYGAAVRFKSSSSIWRFRGLASMFFEWSAHLLCTTMEISANMFSSAARPRAGHLRHQVSDAL
jgi:hypothetical protein